MFRRSIANLLIATVFACPLHCRAAHGEEDGADRAAKPSCCGCCHAGAEHGSSDKDRSPDSDSTPDPGGSCQCICGGAIVGDASLDGVAFDLGWSQPLAFVEPLLVVAMDAKFHQTCTVPWPDVGMNRGRALCCLFSTFQC